MLNPAATFIPILRAPTYPYLPFRGGFWPELFFFFSPKTEFGTPSLQVPFKKQKKFVPCGSFRRWFASAANDLAKMSPPPLLLPLLLTLALAAVVRGQNVNLFVATHGRANATGAAADPLPSIGASNQPNSASPWHCGGLTGRRV